MKAYFNFVQLTCQTIILRPQTLFQHQYSQRWNFQFQKFGFGWKEVSSTFHQFSQQWNFLSKNETFCPINRKVEVSFDFSSIFPTMKLFVQQWSIAGLSIDETICPTMKHRWTFHRFSQWWNYLSNNAASLDFSSIFPTMKLFVKQWNFCPLIRIVEVSFDVSSTFPTMKLFVETFCATMKHFVH